MLVLVIILFMICWGPRLFINAIIKYGLNRYDVTAYRARVVCYLLSFIHSCLNPIVYTLMSSNVRQMMLRSVEGSCSSIAKSKWCTSMCAWCICTNKPSSKTDYKQYFRHRASSSEMICYSRRTTHQSSISTLAEYRTSVILDTDISNYINASTTSLYDKTPNQGHLKIPSPIGRLKDLPENVDIAHKTVFLHISK